MLEYIDCWAQIRIGVGRQEEKQGLSLHSYLFIYKYVYISIKREFPSRRLKEELEVLRHELKGPTGKKDVLPLEKMAFREWNMQSSEQSSCALKAMITLSPTSDEGHFIELSNLF